MPKLIGLLGKKRHGKDTVADYLVSNYGFRKDSLAQPIKDICKILFNFSNEQLFGNLKDVVDENLGITPRKIYQYLGTDIIRKDMNKIILNKNCENFWVDHMTARCIEYMENGESVVISDLRFQNEVDAIHNLGGIVLKINRPNFIDDVNDKHESEQNIDKITNYDHLIENSKDIETLYGIIESLANEFNL